jgi:hypothetical protein
MKISTRAILRIVKKAQLELITIINISQQTHSIFIAICVIVYSQYAGMIFILNSYHDKSMVSDFLS